MDGLPQYLLSDIAPLVTAIAAVLFGVLSHRRNVRLDDRQSLSSQISEIHVLYHNLVEDLGSQLNRQVQIIEELEDRNRELEDRNRELEEVIKTLQEQKQELTQIANNLSARIELLEQKYGL